MKAEELKGKFILDACCGPKEMWFNKNHPNALYIDIRDKYTNINGKEYLLFPDKIMDFRKLDFLDKSFKLVVFDPPHKKTWKPMERFNLTRKYGCLHPETWQSDLKKGLSECYRVLKDYGILIFKWSDHDISLNRIIPLLPTEPLFCNTMCGKFSKSKTYWFCFIKIPKEEFKHGKS